VLRGDAFPRVNPLVDAVNLCQLQERIPYGLYDLDALEPPIVAREGREGEEYEGIRKGAIHVAGKPALFDARGPFGNPTSDSDRTKTTAATRRALVIVFGPTGIDYRDWEKIIDRTAETMLLHATGQVTDRRVVAAGGPP
jgi:DNA/RNA-binding domain of Phe-tRNA-synthetase-like protein